MNKKVLCVGMKRSGSTLQFNIARLLLESQESVINLGYVQKQNLKNKLKAYGKNSKNLIVKCHNPDWNYVGEFACENKILYIYRDLRSVYASMKLRTNVSLNDFIYQMKKDLILYSKFENDNRIFVQKYEEIYRNERHAIYDISNYLEINSIDTLLVEDIVEKVSISAHSNGNFLTLDGNMIITWLFRMLIKMTPKSIIAFLKRIMFTKKIVAFIKSLVTVNSKTLMYSDHISKTKGKPDAWKEILSNEEVCMIELEFNGWLVKHGYL